MEKLTKGELAMNILIVDDEELQLETIRRGIRIHGHQVHMATSGEEALAYLEEHRDDSTLVITDYFMPEMNGMSLVKTIRERYGDIPVILMTAFGDKSLVIEALRNRCDNYLDKPFKPNELMAQIDEIQLQREKRRRRGQFQATGQTKKKEGRLYRFVPAKKAREKGADAEQAAALKTEETAVEQNVNQNINQDINQVSPDLEELLLLEEENPLDRLGGGLSLALPLVKIIFPTFIFLLLALTTFFLLVLPLFR
ncbi:MAG: response regulator [Bacillota bacterium]|jgi:DNA-binding response OmpR family regulator